MLESQPYLQHMVRSAVERLKSTSKGFFVYIHTNTHQELLQCTLILERGSVKDGGKREFQRKLNKSPDFAKRGWGAGY